MNRLRYIIASIVLFVSCLLIVFLFSKQPFIRGFVGDILIMMLMYSVIKIFIDVPTKKLCFILLLFAFSIEFLQYYKLVSLLRLSHIRIARIIIGATFDVYDLLAYAVGTCGILLLEKIRH